MSSSGATEAHRGTEQVHRLKPNAVGLGGVVFMAVATAAPITAMTGNVPVAVASGNGIGAPAGYIVATVVLSIFAIGYVAMARHITATGAFYGFISHGLGRIIGMASELLTVMAYMVFEAGLVGIFSYFAHTTVLDQVGVSVPWQVFAGVMIAVNAILTYFDINLTAKVLGIFLSTEIAVLALMAFGVLIRGGPGNIPLDPINPINAFTGVAPGIGLFFAFWSWVGFESTTLYGEESRNPKKLIPRATLIAVVGVGVFYVFVSWMAISGTGVGQAVSVARHNPFALFFGPSRTYIGEWLVLVFQWLLITGSYACGMAFHNCAARYLYAFGREGFINRRLGHTHPRHGSPHIASFTQTGITVAIVAGFWAAGQDPYTSMYVLMAILGTFALLLVQTLCSFSVIGYFARNHPESRHWFKTFLAPLAGGVGMGAVVYLLISNLGSAAGAASKTLLFHAIPIIVAVVFVVGIVVSVYLRWRRPDRYATIGHIVLEGSEERDPAPSRPDRRPSNGQGVEQQ